MGTIWQQGHENEALIQEFSHEIMLPRDPQSGQPTGQRVLKPFRVAKILDKCSPLLFSSLVTDEKLLEMELTFYRTPAQGVQEHHDTMTKEDATITSITGYMPHAQNPREQHLTHMEVAGSTYRTITKTLEVASASESGDWRTANMA